MKLPSFKLPEQSKEQVPKKPVLLGSQQSKSILPSSFPKPSLAITVPLIEIVKDIISPVTDIIKGDIYWCLRIDDKAKQKKELYTDFMAEHFSVITQKREPVKVEMVKVPRKKITLPMVHVPPLKTPSLKLFLIKFYRWGKK
jgi:hypothetical protein